MDLITDGPRGSFIYFDNIVNLLAIIFNCVVFVAIVQRKFRPEAYRLFLINLAACDLFVCTVNMLTTTYQLSMLSDIKDHPYFRCVANVLRTLQLAGLFTNLLNLCGMSVDHFFGVVFPVQYRNFMSEKVACLAILSIWLISFTLAFLDIPVNLLLYNESLSGIVHSKSQPAAEALPPLGISSGSSENIFSILFSNDNGSLPYLPQDLPDNSNLIDDFFSAIHSYDPTSKPLEPSGSGKPPPLQTDRKASLLNQTLTLLSNEPVQKSPFQQGVCNFFSAKKFWFEMCVIGMVAICFAMLTVCYGVIFRRVIGRFADATGRRTKKLIFTTIIFLSTFTICWIPFVVFEFSMFFIAQTPENNKDDAAHSKTMFQVHKVLYSLLVMYPLLDPIIYATRVPAVQQFLLSHVAKFIPCCNCNLQMISSPSHQRASKALLSTYELSNIRRPSNNMPQSQRPSLALLSATP